MQFVRFLAVGSLNTLLGLACIFAAMQWLGLDYRIANILGYLAGFGVSFFLNRSWTFGARGPLLDSALRWALLVGTCFFLNLAVVVYLRQQWKVDAMVAQVGGIVVYTLLSFAGARLLVFRHAPAASQHR